MLRPWIFVGFTGHRTLANPDLIARRIREALDRIASHTGENLAAVSSAAKGADTLFVEAALQRPEPLPWVLLLPFPEAEFFNDRDFSPDDLRRIRPLVPRAVRIHTEPAPGSDRTEQRESAFADCSARTVDECDYLIAVWDGKEGKPGGTGDTVAYAREQKKPFLWIHAVTGEMREENFLPAAPVQTTPLPRPVGDGLSALQATLAHYDAEAIKHGPLAQTIVRDVIFLHLLATAAGLFEPVFGLVAFAAAVPKTFKLAVLIYAARRNQTQHHVKHDWLRARIIAELCRAAIATWPLPYSDKTHLPVPVPGFRAWQRSLCLWKLLAPPPTQSLAAARDAYVRNRLDDPDTGQITYFGKQLKRSEIKQRRWQQIAHWSTSGAIACAVLGLIFMALFSFCPDTALAHAIKPWKSPVSFLSLSLPLLASAAFTYLMASDCNRRVERNQEMLRHLLAARERIRRANTHSGLERRVAETEALLLLEVLEWHSVTHFTASAH